MFRLAAALLIATIWCMGGAKAAAPRPPIDPTRIAGLADGLMAQGMASHSVPGAVVAIVGPDGVIHQRGYGVARLAPQIEPVTPDTPFQIASISKTFLYIAIMQLAERGAISLDDPVNKHLPEALRVPDGAYPDQPILIRHLMSHTPGFEDSLLGHLFVDSPDRIMSMTDYIKTHRVNRVRPPGTVPAYSNYGIILLGAIIEHVTGQPFADYMEARVFRPLGMATASYREPYPADLAAQKGLPAPLDPKVAASAAQMILGAPGAWRLGAEEYATALAPAASVRASAAEMALYAQALLDPGRLEAAGVLRRETFESMMHPLVAMPGEPSRALLHGFFHRIYPNGVSAFGHSGQMVQGASDFFVVPELGVAIFISTNGPGGFAFAWTFVERLVREIAPAPDWTPVRNARTLAQAKSVEGAWLWSRRPYSRTESAVYGLMTEFASAEENGDLLFGSALAEPRRFVPVGGDTWVDLKSRDVLVIAPGPDGAPILWFNGIWVYERTPYWRSIAWIGPIFIAAMAVGAFAAISLARRLARPRLSTLRQRVAGALTDVAALAWLVGAGSLFYLLARSTADGYASLLFSYPGPVPLITWTITAASAASVTAAGALAFALASGAPGGWSWWRLVKQIAAALVLLAASLTAALNGWLGFSHIV